MPPVNRGYFYDWLKIFLTRPTEYPLATLRINAVKSICDCSLAASEIVRAIVKGIPLS